MAALLGYCRSEGWDDHPGLLLLVENAVCPLFKLLRPPPPDRILIWRQLSLSCEDAMLGFSASTPFWLGASACACFALEELVTLAVSDSRVRDKLFSVSLRVNGEDLRSWLTAAATGERGVHVEVRVYAMHCWIVQYLTC